MNTSTSNVKKEIKTETENTQLQPENISTKSINSDDSVISVSPKNSPREVIDLTQPAKDEVSEIFDLIFKELNTNKYSITSHKTVSKDQNGNVFDETLVRTLIKLK